MAITASPKRKFDAVTVLTGAMGAKVIGPLIDSSNSPLDVSVLAVENTYFGGNTGVTGLLTGTDLCEALTDADPGRRYLLPDVCLSDAGQFLDGLSVDDLPVPVDVIPTHGHALREALGLT